MKTYVFLLLFGFIQLVFCDCNQHINVTDNDSYPVCPIDLFRRKRSNAEYTRWRANQDLTTNEFLVKVLDEDLTTPQMHKIVAINIQPLTARGEKIIIGGAKVPPPTTPLALSTTDALDYTRFAIPPIEAITRAGELYHAPVSHPPRLTAPPIKPPVLPKGVSVNRNSQRDDSPPASPQFLARTPMLMGREYAPIAPVAFNPRPGMAPVMPPSTRRRPSTSTNTDDQEFETSQIFPTRTSPYPHIPIRTSKIDEFRILNSFDEASQTIVYPEVVTRSTYLIPERTITPAEINLINEIEAYFEPTPTNERKLLGEVANRREEELIQKIAEKDSESSYNMMFYNDEDASNVNSKKDDQDISDTYFEKKTNLEDSEEHVSPESKEHEIEDNTDNRTSSFIQLLVSPEDSDNYTKQMSSGVIGIPDGEILKLKERKDAFRDKRRPFCSLIRLRQLRFNSPRTLPEITNQLKQWAEVSPLAKWVDITDGNFTTMENPIYMMMVDDPSSGQSISAKQTVMIVAGIQGRDHHAVAAAMYVLYQLIERGSAHTDLLSKYRFWVIPVFNPDGYDYSMTFPQRREWNKNLRQIWDKFKDPESYRTCEDHGLRCLIQPCYGVNLDRNFEYQWIPAEELRTEQQCGNLYSGARQLSELETRALTQFMHKQQTQLYTFMAYKEGEILGVMYPYSHTKKKRVYDHVYRKRASRAAAAAYSISNRPYVAGQTSEFLPLYAGGIEDWMEGHAGIDNTYTIMMFRPSDSDSTKLITERVVHEAYAATDTLLLQSTEPDLPAPPVVLKQHDLQQSSAVTPTTSPTHLLTILHIVILLYG